MRGCYVTTPTLEIYRVLFYYGKKERFRGSFDWLFCFSVYFALSRKWMWLREKNGVIRDPSQTAGIIRDFRSECNMRIYSAYSVCWLTIFGPLKYGSRSLSEITLEISLEKRVPCKLTVKTKARLESVFSVACTRKIA